MTMAKIRFMTNDVQNAKKGNRGGPDQPTNVEVCLGILCSLIYTILSIDSVIMQ